MKFSVIINNKRVQTLLNNNLKVNILLYHIALVLELTIWSNITVVMKEVKNEKSSFLEYISDVSVQIDNIMVRQPFFVLEKDSNSCILSWLFEMITRMARQTLNDRSVRVTIFNLNDDMTQATFQPYAPDDCDDWRECKIIEYHAVQFISHLN